MGSMICIQTILVSLSVF